MKGIKGRLLKRFRTIPSIYTSKHHVVTAPCKSPEHFSATQNPHNLPNYIQQEDRTNPSLDLREERKNGIIIMPTDLVPTKEIDDFEECECKLINSMPQLESSSSTCSTPTSNNGKTNEEGGPTYLGLRGMPTDGANSSYDTSLSEFKEKCPPGGSDKIILYTTSLRGIRKTYEDCNAIKFLLESFHVVYFERDVSMHLEFRDELWEILGGRIVPPRLFIKGRHIGGADEVVTLHELGMFKQLLQGIPVLGPCKCGCCGGVRFLLCLECNGSCKIYKGNQGNRGNLFGRCPKCNENGLIKCPTCS